MKQYIIYFLAILLSTSCRRELDISNVLQKDRLVINAVLNDKDKVQIWVSHTTSLSDSIKPKAIESASVEIVDENGTTTTCLYNLGTDYYESNLLLTAGKTYTISVKAQGYPDASARVSLPDVAGLKQAVWKDSTGLDSFGFPLGTITISIDDNGSENNHYRTTIFYWDDLLAEWFPLVPQTTDAEINNNAIETEDGGLIFSDRSFNGKNKTIGFITPFGFASITPKFLIVSENLSEDYYRYFKSLDDYRAGGGLFNEPTAIYTNVTNGLGIAAGSSIRRDTIQ